MKVQKIKKAKKKLSKRKEIHRKITKENIIQCSNCLNFSKKIVFRNENLTKDFGEINLICFKNHEPYPKNKLLVGTEKSGFVVSGRLLCGHVNDNHVDSPFDLINEVEK